MNNPLENDLPPEAKTLVGTLKDKIQELQKKAQKEIQEFQKKTNLEINKIRMHTDIEISQHSQGLLEQLKAMQVAYTKEGKLDEALAIREEVRLLKYLLINPRPDPGNMLQFHQNIGESFTFEVIGSNNGPIWGTKVYTSDSYLSTAAVHAGVLGLGEKGLVKVILLDTSDYTKFEGSYQNGINSRDWGTYAVGYEILRQ